MIGVMKKPGFSVLLLVLTLFARNAGATLAPMLESSFHEGYVFYDEAGLRGRIDFAVYDTEHAEYGDEYLDVGIEAPGEGRYIYAYQIFNDYFVSEEAVAYFALLGIDESTVDGIGSQEDPESGVEPGDTFLDGVESRAVWEFNGSDMYVWAGEHSWFLVFGSDDGPVAGDYEIRGPDSVMVPAPEPSTVALLGLGSVIFFVKRRKPVR
ncbi:MAG: PEP-CTERM sorting domain-containing protein [Planctomycetota bacterium]|jgi:hypothetical protein